MSHPELPFSVERRLRAELFGEVCTDHPIRALYSTDASIYQIFPLAVVFPRNRDDLRTLVSIANETETPLIFRGGGTGLAGETVGQAIIADCSRHMNTIHSIDAAQGIVRVDSGVILERLNHHLAPFGKQFGPDPGSATRCTIGGMAANNAAGMHSLLHGVTRDHLISLELILSDGSVFETDPFAPMPAVGAFSRRLHDELAVLLARHADLIETKTPRHLKRHRAGYLLHDVLLDKKPETLSLDLAKLICGSEGTLAAIASATLHIVDRLPETGIGLFSFRKVVEAADAVPLVLQHSPSSIEMLDQTIVRMAREAGRITGDLVPQEAKSILLVEFAGDSIAEIRHHLETVQNTLRAHTPVLEQAVIACEPADRQRIWAVRSSGEPLLNRRPGSKRAIAFVEDAAVHPDQLGQYVKAISRIFGSRNVEFGTYGHAGVGVLHVRPYFDLRNPDDVKKIVECADEIYDTVIALGGSVSGEHGDGWCRTHYVRKQYGELYPVFGKIKNLFDPKGILNPDKIWRDIPRNSLVENLRLRPEQHYRLRKRQLVWKDNEFETLLDRCNSCGECKGILRTITMCPTYKDWPVEANSPRGRVNLLRALLNGTIEESHLCSDEVQAIFNNCISCKGCKMECPLGVDVSHLALEAKAHHVARHGQKWHNLLLALSEQTSQASSLLAPVVNPLMKMKPVRQIMEATMGIDAKRSLPSFSFSTLSRFRKVCPHPAQPSGKVALFLDLYGRYNDPQLIFDFLEVLRINNIEVEIPKQRPSGLPAIAYASLGIARSLLMANARSFSRYIDAGYRVVTTEPSAALALREESLALSDHPSVKNLSEATTDAMSFLAQLKSENKLQTQGLHPLSLHLGYHVPCHVKALGAQKATLDVMSLIPGLKIRQIAEGCCGIAGTWGMKHENYEKSMQIGKPMLEALADPGIEAGLSECSTCRMQMHHGSSKPALHPIALLAQSYRQ